MRIAAFSAVCYFCINSKRLLIQRGQDATLWLRD